jgi:hypothetical protein
MELPVLTTTSVHRMAVAVGTVGCTQLARNAKGILSAGQAGVTTPAKMHFPAVGHVGTSKQMTQDVSTMLSADQTNACTFTAQGIAATTQVSVLVLLARKTQTARGISGVMVAASGAQADAGHALLIVAGMDATRVIMTSRKCDVAEVASSPVQPKLLRKRPSASSSVSLEKMVGNWRALQMPSRASPLASSKWDIHTVSSSQT